MIRSWFKKKDSPAAQAPTTPVTTAGMFDEFGTAAKDEATAQDLPRPTKSAKFLPGYLAQDMTEDFIADEDTRYDD